jgi:mRNA interferase YafQ
LLCSGRPLPATYRDHALKGDLADRRECHIHGDLLFVYRKDGDALVLLALDIGTHHELFGV